MPVTDDDEYTMSSNHSTSSKAELRKSNKPIMEKRRRARINHCLNELKTLILNAMKKDPARHSKLEKADILEMTVKHLQTVQRQQLAAAVATDPTVITKFRSGFDECATEVSRYISRLDGVDHGVKQRLSAHLHRCVSSLQQMAPSNQPGQHDDNNNSNQRALLIPSRLPSGELALVIPKGYSGSNYLPSAPNSAFTVIKNDSLSPRFQPFQVEIPNSQITAHISIPEAFEKRNASASPKKEKLSPATNKRLISPMLHRDVDRRIYDRSEEGDRLHLPSLSEEVEHHEIASERRVQMNFSMVQKFNMRPDSNARLHAALVSQKPNPNYQLNPKSQSGLKYVRHGDHRLHDRNTLEAHGPSPPKMARYQCQSPPNSEARSSVIVDQGKDVLLASTSKANPPDNQVTNRDMWRPW